MNESVNAIEGDGYFIPESHEFFRVGDRLDYTQVRKGERLFFHLRPEERSFIRAGQELWKKEGHERQLVKIVRVVKGATSLDVTYNYGLTNDDRSVSLNLEEDNDTFACLVDEELARIWVEDNGKAYKRAG